MAKPLTEPEIEEAKELIRTFCDKEYDAYYLLECQLTGERRIYHRNIAGSFYRIMIDDKIEDKIIEYLSIFGSIYQINEIANYIAFTIDGPWGTNKIFKLYAIDNLIEEVL